MKKVHLLPLAALLAITGVGAASAQGTVNMTDQDQLLISQIQTDKRAVVLDAMNLSDAQVAVFTPIYDQYQAEMKKLFQRNSDLVNKYAATYDTMSDADAKKLLEEAFKLRIERTETLRKYARKMEKVLPATKVLRFVQIENKLTALLDWQAAQLIPLVK
jgi:hypothetical protein